MTEQLIAPVKVRTQALVAQAGSTISACKKSHSVIHATPCAIETQSSDAGGRQFNRERYAIQPPANLAGKLKLPVVGIHDHLYGVRTLQEQPDCGMRKDMDVRGTGRWRFERINFECMLERYAQPFPAGHDDAHVVICSEQGIDYLRHVRDQMFSIIDK